MPGVADNVKTVMDALANETDFKMGYLLQVENLDLTQKYLNTSIDKLES
jgi:hypothetical protein